MLYVDENNLPIENPDLTLGYLVDKEWIDHPQIDEEGHFEYIPTGVEDGKIQNYIVDIPFQPAWKELTVQQYIKYTEEELEILAKNNYSLRCDNLENRCLALETNAIQTFPLYGGTETL